MSTLRGQRFTAAERQDIDRLMKRRARLLSRVAAVDAALKRIEKDGAVIRKHCAASEDEVHAAIKSHQEQVRQAKAMVAASLLATAEAREARSLVATPDHRARSGRVQVRAATGWGPNQTRKPDMTRLTLALAFAALAAPALRAKRHARAQGARGAMSKSESGGYCAPMTDRAQPTVPKVGQCPSGWSQSGGYCLQMRRP